jgi:hypothetical protein
MATKTAGATPLDKAREARQANRVPTDETGEARFRRLANARLTPTVKAITRLGNLARVPGGKDAPKVDGKVPAYKPTTEQVDAIISTLRKAVGQVEASLRGGKAASDVPTF